MQTVRLPRALSLQLMLLLAALLLGIILTGCGSSEEAEKEKAAQAKIPTATAVMQKQIDDMRADNTAMKSQVEKLQQDNRAATAHAAELETQLAEAKERATKPVPVQTQAAPPPVNIDAGSAYQEAMGLFHKRNYDAAMEKFMVVAQSGGNLADHAQYWVGECEYAKKEYESAVEAFQKVFAFSKSTKKDDSQMMIANSYLAMGQKKKAKEEYQTLVSKYPASPFVKRAKAKLAHL